MQGPVYDLFIGPLRRDENLTANIVSGVKDSLSAIVEDPFSVRDVVVAVREVVDNIYSHADWENGRSSSLHVWYEVLGDKPRFNLVATNPVADEEVTKKNIAHLTEIAGDRQKATKALEKHLTENLHTSGSGFGGLGLLQIASSERCHISTFLEDNTLSVQVNVQVPELRAG